MILGLFFNSCITYKLLGFLGRDVEDIKKTLQKFLTGSHEHLRQSLVGKSKGGWKLHRLSCRPFPILSPLPTIFPKDFLARAQKRSM